MAAPPETPPRDGRAASSGVSEDELPTVVDARAQIVTSGAPAVPRPAARAAAASTARACPACGQRFSGEARFCPFDGEPLGDAPARDSIDPLVGSVIDGRYEVTGVLGEGGMGVVYRVRHRTLGKELALKAMRRDVARERDLAQRFLQEAKAAASIGHPNIVQITDFGELPGGAPYFVMELLDGEPLAQLIKRGGPLPAARAVRLVEQAASALAAAHKLGIVHRDLKPDNVHVASGDIVKIVDFGVAKVAGSSRLTRPGIVFGTPHYMSPEQASGQPVDHRTDVYALGIIMYEMFTGRVPFEADTYMGVLTKHMFMTPDPPSRVCEAARELGALEDVILRCLEKKPEARYGTMEALLHDLDQIVQFTGSGDVAIARPSRTSTRPSRTSALLADELEPPARDEIDAGRPGRADGVPRGPAPALIAVVAVGAIAVGVGGFFVARRSGGHPAAAARTSAPAPVASIASASPGPAAAPAAVVAVSAAPAVDAVPPATPRARGTSDTPPPAGTRAGKAPKGTAAPLPVPPAATPARTAAKPDKPPPPTGDIVDPWGAK